jgi:hypothetical protein
MFGCDNLEEDKESRTCNLLNDENNYLIENDYRLYSMNDMDEFKDSLGCIDYDRWLSRELFYRSKDKEYFDSLYSVVELPSFKFEILDERGYQKEVIRLFRTNFAYGSSEILIIDGIRNNSEINLIKYIVQFDRSCSTPLIHTIGNKKFNKSCFEVESKKVLNINQEKWRGLWQVIYDTDFMNIMYFDTGEIMLCDGYDYHIMYNNASQVIDGKREFYRSCPSEKSPIKLVADKLIEISN